MAKVIPSVEHIRQMFERYAVCLSEGDVEGVVSLFAPEALLEDPIGTEYRGHAAIRDFFNAVSTESVGGSASSLKGKCAFTMSTPPVPLRLSVIVSIHPLRSIRSTSLVSMSKGGLAR